MTAHHDQHQPDIYDPCFGQISIIPKPESFGDFGEVPLQSPPFRVTTRREQVVIICPVIGDLPGTPNDDHCFDWSLGRQIEDKQVPGVYNMWVFPKIGGTPPNSPF